MRRSGSHHSSSLARGTRSRQNHIASGPPAGEAVKWASGSPSVPRTTVGVPRRPIPGTGSDVGPVLSIALLLVVIGGLLSRRRRAPGAQPPEAN